MKKPTLLFSLNRFQAPSKINYDSFDEKCLNKSEDLSFAYSQLVTLRPSTLFPN